MDVIVSDFVGGIATVSNLVCTTEEQEYKKLRINSTILLRMVGMIGVIVYMVISLSDLGSSCYLWVSRVLDTRECRYRDEHHLR